MSRFLIINGPNLNMLGEREPQVYGDETLSQIMEYTQKKLENFPVEIEWFQSNNEGDIVTKIQDAVKKNYKAMVINPAAYSHYSLAILDALKMIPFPIVEVHLSNTHKREEFRKTKLTAMASTIIMEGLGKNSYFLAIYSQLIK
ncbi:MAG: type II 3-dehydroquinate dehydratase [Bacteriovoracales bacterium]